MDISYRILLIGVSILAFKAITIGSEFNFYYWFKYGRRYWDWYNKREEFKP